jgi:hypothetical protein
VINNSYHPEDKNSYNAGRRTKTFARIKEDEWQWSP